MWYNNAIHSLHSLLFKYIIKDGSAVLLEINGKVNFDWQGSQFEGIIEKEYENAVLVTVVNPTSELKDKYLSRLVVSKKICQVLV